MKSMMEEMLELAKGQSVEPDALCNIKEMTIEIMEEQRILHPEVTITVDEQSIPQNPLLLFQKMRLVKFYET